MHGYMLACYIGVSGSFAMIGRKACSHGAFSWCKTHCVGWWLRPHCRCRSNGATERLKMRRCKETRLFSFLLFRLVSCAGWSPRGVPSPRRNSSGTWQRALEGVLVSAWYKWPVSRAQAQATVRYGWAPYSLGLCYRTSLVRYCKPI